MVSKALLAVCLQGGLALASPAAAAVRAAPSPIPTGLKWQFEYQDPLVVPQDSSVALQPEDAQVWVIDLWHAYKNRNIITRLHDRKKTVICYFNLGAVQPYDCDFQTVLDKGLFNGKWFKEVEGNSPYCEKFNDLTNPTVVQLIKDRLKLASDIGCDGVDPDNINAYEFDPAINVDQNVAIIKDFISYAKSLNPPLLFGQKNADELVDGLYKFADFAVLENCVLDNFCSIFNKYIQEGKAVAAIEYPQSLGNANAPFGCRTTGINSSDKTKFCSGTNGNAPKTPAGFSEILKLDFDRFGVNACTQYCDGKGIVLSPTTEGTVGVDTCQYIFPQCKTNPASTEYCENECCDPDAGDKCPNTAARLFRA